MFCRQCGEKLLEGSSFCMSCGTEVNSDQPSVTEPPQKNEEIEEKKTPQQPLNPPQKPEEQHQQHTYMPQNNVTTKSSFLSSKLPILIPIISLLVVSTLLVFTFLSEQKKNDTVLELQESAETAALNGDYDSAINQLNEAMEIRPDYEVLRLNIDEITRAQAFSTELEAVRQLLANQDFNSAEQQIGPLKEQANKETSPLFNSFKEIISNEEGNIVIGKLKQEIADLNSVDSLASKLSTLDSLSSPEADSIKEEILTKIVEITSTEVTDFLANNQFAEALNAINKALSYKENDDTLLQLKDQVEQEKLAYEEQAAQDDLHNRTAAVEVTSFTAALEDNGDVTFEGTIKSVATVPIYTIIIYYALFDANDEYVTEGFVYVEPELLEPGDEGYFYGLVEGINEEVLVEIINITWYFDQ
ncbi:hypothetical protein GCM10008025_15590 [Ornithinibacillus halotolerans]|uniref:Zinc-ribbon domain-containing protein n=1 Tax=Ornithinibacillus halotolerans TaxID=1274357 RepID=A0A916RVZ5_9BACI|nr:hypothetical protein GCM10008025_15590 [Ornithinibacillus halotolerans]